MVEVLVPARLLRLLGDSEAVADGGHAGDARRVVLGGAKDGDVLGGRLDEEDVAVGAGGRDHLEVEGGLLRPARVGRRIVGATAPVDLAEAAVRGGARGQTHRGAVHGEVGLGVGVVHGVDHRDGAAGGAGAGDPVGAAQVGGGVAVGGAAGRLRRRGGGRASAEQAAQAERKAAEQAAEKAAARRRCGEEDRHAPRLAGEGLGAGGEPRARGHPRLGRGERRGQAEQAGHEKCGDAHAGGPASIPADHGFPLPVEIPPAAWRADGSIPLKRGVRRSPAIVLGCTSP